MNNIPLHVKISLINNYLQSNIIKSRGKAEHDDWLISEILEGIKEDLTLLDKDKHSEKIPLSMLLKDIKQVREKHITLRDDLGDLIEELKKLYDKQADSSTGLTPIIKNIESMSADK